MLLSWVALWKSWEAFRFPRVYVGKYPRPPMAQCMSWRQPWVSDGGWIPNIDWKLSFHAVGMSAMAIWLLIIFLSRSKRRRMWRSYVASSASTLMSEYLAWLMVCRNSSTDQSCI